MLSTSDIYSSELKNNSSYSNYLDAKKTIQISYYTRCSYIHSDLFMKQSRSLKQEGERSFAVSQPHLLYSKLKIATIWYRTTIDQSFLPLIFAILSIIKPFSFAWPFSLILQSHLPLAFNSTPIIELIPHLVCSF